MPAAYTAVTDFLRDVRPPANQAFEVRFKTPPGEQAQIDCAQFHVVFTEEPTTPRIVWLFSMVLGHKLSTDFGVHLPPILVTKLLNEWLKPVRQRNIQLRHLAHPDESAQDAQIIVSAELICQSSAGMKIIGQMGARCFKIRHAPPQC